MGSLIISIIGTALLILIPIVVTILIVVGTMVLIGPALKERHNRAQGRYDKPLQPATRD